MKRESRKSAARFCSHVAIVLTGIALLFPASASVLCIAPGGHVAVEDINAACCTRSAINIPGGHQQGDGFTRPGGCQNCTDVFLAPSTRGAILEPHDTSTPSSPSDAGLQGRLPLDPLSSPRGSTPVIRIDTPVASASSVPLRC